ncbi:monocarboxylate transporter [Anopheles darlingi]|uniref:Monocarboxylate transporter n=1 Tax=Anopheles darlingi TaxID=43151 RepID=W5JJ46_ANODA|nr:monocarboxylate transporter [Anopheles darlingi]
MEKLKAAKKVAPDGGWGWMATFGVSLVNLATRSIEPSFGLLFGDLLTDLQVGTTGAAIIISALDVMMNFSGLFVGPLLKEFSYRKVAIAGSLLCWIGLALTSPATSMAHILATYSVINGIGVGLATSAAFVALNHYFAKKRGQAVGLSMAGTALGMLIMPQLVRILLELYDFRGAVLVLSGMALHATVGAMLLQPIKWHLREEEVDIEMVEATPAMGIILEQEDDGDNDSLPEIKSLLFPRRIGSERKHSDSGTIAGGGSAGLAGGATAVGAGTVNGSGGLPGGPIGLPKRPTFPRITSSVSIQNGPPSAGALGMRTRPSFPRIASTASMGLALRKRRESVVSQLSTLDFTGSGSCMHIHVDTGDADAEDVDYQIIRRVNTHVGVSLNSFARVPSRTGSRRKMETVKSELGLEMVKPKVSFLQRFTALMDVGLLRDPIYLNILFGLSIFYVAEMNFKMVTPFFMASLGFDKSETAFVLSVSALTDIAARIIVPPIGDRLKLRKRYIFMVSLIFVAISRSIVAHQQTYIQVMTWLSITGFFRGIALANFTLCVSEYSSLEKLPAAFGWHMPPGQWSCCSSGAARRKSPRLSLRPIRPSSRTHAGRVVARVAILRVSR